MPEKSAKANVQPVRQRTQYTCMAASMAMCLKAQGQEHCDEDRVNKVMGAQPMQGASWEQALACAQHYGMRATLVSPCTLSQLKAWTDKGVPVIIAWNPEGRDWSHASVVFDVTDDGDVYVADPNIPDPEETVRKVSKQDFYARWYEKWPNYLVRRVAMAIDREVTPDGRQVMASLQQPLMTRRDYGVQPPMKTSEMAQLLKTAENLPPDVERYVEEGKAQGLDESAAWAVAWSRYCVAADTYVFTSLGMQTIGDLAQQSVMARQVHADGAVATTLRVTVTTHKGQGLSSHVVQTGVKPVVKVTTKHGYSLTCTPDHRLLALNTEDYSVEWVNAADCAGRYLVLPSRGTWGSKTVLPNFTYATNAHNNLIPFRRPTELTHTLARVLGYLVSEGAVTDEGVQFSNSDPVVVADYVRCMTELFGDPPKVEWHQPNASNRCTKPGANVRSRTRWYREFFQSLGLCSGVAQDKRVPDVILTAPQEFVTEFLRGFIEGDGYVGDDNHPNRVDLATSSPTLARQLHLILANLGVFATLEQNARGYFNVRVHSAPMVQRFVDTVGGGVFKVPTQISTRLKQRGSEFDCVPATGITRLHKKIANRFPGTNRVSLSRIKSNWGVLESCAGGHPVVKNLRTLLDQGYLFDLVDTLAPDGEAEVYDMSVPGDESFVANGLIAHNCKYKNPGSEHCQKSPSEYFPGRKAKFEKGKSMTIDEVAEVVGPEFKEMNENPPDSVVKVREQMGKKASYPKVMKELKDDLDRKAITRSEFNELSEAVGNAETEQAARKIVQDHRKGRTAGELLSMDMFADMLKDSKFEKGKPADPTENMSEEDAAEWERQNELNKDNFKGAGLPPGARDEEEAALVTQFFGKAKTAAGGKYGFTKATEDACGVGVNKLSKAAKRIAEALYAKDKESPAFLSKHAARSGNKAASMLLSAMSDLGPAADVAKLAKTAGRSGNGLYGFSEKTAKLALDACNALQHEAGVIAADLFARKGMNAAHLAGYLSANAKKAKCAFSQMLADAAPDVELDVEATVKKSGKKAGDFLASEEEATEGEDWDAPGTPKC